MDILVSFFISTVGIVETFVYQSKAHQRRRRPDNLVFPSLTTHSSSSQANKPKTFIHKVFCAVLNFIKSTGSWKLQKPSTNRFSKRLNSNNDYDIEKYVLPMVNGDVYTTGTSTRIAPEANLCCACKTKMIGRPIDSLYQPYPIKRRSARSSKNQNTKILQSPFTSTFPVPESQLEPPAKNQSDACQLSPSAAMDAPESRTVSPANDQQAISHQSSFNSTLDAPEPFPLTKNHDVNDHDPCIGSQPEDKDTGTFIETPSDPTNNTVTTNEIDPSSFMQVDRILKSDSFEVPPIEPPKISSKAPIRSSLRVQTALKHAKSLQPTGLNSCKEPFPSINQSSRPLLLTAPFYPDSRFLDSKEDPAPQTLGDQQGQYINSLASCDTNPFQPQPTLSEVKVESTPDLPISIYPIPTDQNHSSCVLKVKLRQAKTIRLWDGRIEPNPFWHEIYDNRDRTDLV